VWSVVGTPATRALEVRFLARGGPTCLQWNGFQVVVSKNEVRYVFAGARAPILVKNLPLVTVFRLSPFAIVRTDESQLVIGPPDTPILDYSQW
jgi:hypothetical protein